MVLGLGSSGQCACRQLRNPSSNTNNTEVEFFYCVKYCFKTAIISENGPRMTRLKRFHVKVDFKQTVTAVLKL